MMRVLFVVAIVIAAACAAELGETEQMHELESDFMSFDEAKKHLGESEEMKSLDTEDQVNAPGTDAIASEDELNAECKATDPDLMKANCQEKQSESQCSGTMH